MQLPFLTKKSRGVPVTPATYADLKAANLARDSGDWSEASAGYAKAVQREPHLTHIWVQLGHAETKQGNRERAEAAYLKAATLAPRDADPLIHLGHVRKDQGDLFGAARCYLEAAQRDTGALDAAGELQRLIARIVPANRPDLRTMLGWQLAGTEPEETRPDVWLDLSDAVAAAIRGGSLMGAARADAERAEALLRLPGVGACAHVEGHHGWLRLSPKQVRTLLEPSGGATSTGAGQPAAWVQLELIFAPVLTFGPGDRLVRLREDAKDLNAGLFAAAARTQGALVVAPDAAQPRPGEPGGDFLARVRGMADAGGGAAEPASVPFGAFIGMGKGQGGLALRSGTGWPQPQGWGSWTHPGGSELTLRVDDTAAPLRLTVLLRGLPTRAGGFQLLCEDGTTIEGKLEADERRWFSTDLPPQPGRFRVLVKGRQAEAVRERPDAPLLAAGVGIVGLHLCRQADTAARHQLLEALTFGDLDWR